MENYFMDLLMECFSSQFLEEFSVVKGKGVKTDF